MSESPSCQGDDVLRAAVPTRRAGYGAHTPSSTVEKWTNRNQAERHERERAAWINSLRNSLPVPTDDELDKTMTPRELAFITRDMLRSDPTAWRGDDPMTETIRAELKTERQHERKTPGLAAAHEAAHRAEGAAIAAAAAALEAEALGAAEAAREAARKPKVLSMEPEAIARREYAALRKQRIALGLPSKGTRPRPPGMDKETLRLHRNQYARDWRARDKAGLPTATVRPPRRKVKKECAS